MDYFDSRLVRVQQLEQVRTNEVLVRGYLELAHDQWPQWTNDDAAGL